MICFICLEHFPPVTVNDRGGSRGRVTYSEFVSFLQNYLNVSSSSSSSVCADGSLSQADKSTARAEPFCEPCSKTVSIICELYKELCALKLQLSSQLEKLGGLIKVSKRIAPVGGRDEDELENRRVIKALADQLRTGTNNVCDLRQAIIFKCFENCEAIAKKNQECMEHVDVEFTVKTEVESLNGDEDDAEPLHDDYDQEDQSPDKEEVAEAKGGNRRKNEGDDDDNDEIENTPLDSGSDCLHDMTTEEINTDSKRRRLSLRIKIMHEGHNQRTEETEGSCESDEESVTSGSDINFAPSPDGRSNSDSGSECSERMDTEPENEGIKTKAKLKHHKHTEKAPRRGRRPAPPPCSICGLQLVSLAAFDNHRKTAHQLGIECPDCSILISTRESLVRHRKIKHGTKCPHTCPHCNKSFPIKSSLTRHIMVHSKPKKRIRETRVIKQKRKSKPREKRSYSCNICGTVVEGYLGSFRVHMRTHPKETWVETCVCEFCGESFPDQELLQRHKSYNHSTNEIFMCDLCGRICLEKGTLDRHRASHAGEKRFACHLCPARYIAKMSLKKHLRNDHGKVQGEEFTSGEGQQPSLKWKCRALSCTQMFSDDMQLKSHVEKEHIGVNHDDVSVIMCKLCGQNFVHQQGLQRHKEVHSREKAFKCHVCQKGFSQQNSLKDHLEGIHGEGKDIRCTQTGCEKKFTCSKYLLKHLREKHEVYVSKIKKRVKSNAVKN